jgi:hydrogenase nickel insertion protein HypA
MHEATIAQSILKIASRKLLENHLAISISTIKVVIGEFRNVDWESLQFAFDSLKNTYPGCQNCRLDTEIISARAQCRQCNYIYHPQLANAFRCPECNNGIGKLTEGEELDIVQMTLESEEKEQNNYARIS